MRGGRGQVDVGDLFVVWIPIVNEVAPVLIPIIFPDEVTWT